MEGKESKIAGGTFRPVPEEKHLTCLINRMEGGAAKGVMRKEQLVGTVKHIEESKNKDR